MKISTNFADFFLQPLLPSLQGFQRLIVATPYKWVSQSCCGCNLPSYSFQRLSETHSYGHWWRLEALLWENHPFINLLKPIGIDFKNRRLSVKSDKVANGCIEMQRKSLFFRASHANFKNNNQKRHICVSRERQFWTLFLIYCIDTGSFWVHVNYYSICRSVLRFQGLSVRWAEIRYHY